MCFALPVKISKIEKNLGIGENGKKVKLNLLDNCQVGDYVLAQADIAVEKISKRRAQDLEKALRNNFN